MKINGLSIYNQYDGIKKEVSGEKGNPPKINDVNNLTRTSKTNNDNSVEVNQYLKNFDPNKVITKQERKYFMNMFPESQEIIEKHVLFNRNAKIQSPEIQKGRLIDGRI